MKKLEIKLTEEQTKILADSGIVELNGQRFAAQPQESAQLIGFMVMYTALITIKSKAELDNLIAITKEQLLALGVEADKLPKFE